MTEHKKTIRLSAVHAAYLDIPPESDPKNENFTEETALAYVNSNIEHMLRWLREAGEKKADLACTNEDFAAVGTYGRDLDHPALSKKLGRIVEPMIVERVGETAKKYGMHIAANYTKFEGDDAYNATSLFGRDGEIIGTYKKVHPADGERVSVKRGGSFPVFETDIGRIGFAICYDIIFPEVFRCLALNGADIIVHQTQGWGACGKAVSAGEAFMRVRAAENSVYFVVAKNIQSEGGKSLILDNYGNILAEAAGVAEGIAIADIEPDFDLIDEYCFDNFYGGVESTKARQLLARLPAAYGGITEQNPPVLTRYRGMELCETKERMTEIIRSYQEMDGETRARYHW